MTPPLYLSDEELARVVVALRLTDQLLAAGADHDSGPLASPFGVVDAPSEVLRKLLGVVAAQLEVLRTDLAQIYDDQFIETCAEWVLPYIGDLVGIRPLDDGVSNLTNRLAGLLRDRKLAKDDPGDGQ
jgi:hypothetical protein